MWITIYTDASFKEGEAGWAVYIKSEKLTIKRSGKCIGFINDSNHAEMYAIAKAIQIISEKYNFMMIQGIYLRTDSKFCINIIEAKREFNNDTSRLWDRVNAFIQRTQPNLKWNLKHIKSHKKDKSKQTWLNNWCDEQSKLARIK